MVKSGDVVYCDPPYLTDTDNFTAYHTQGFTHLDHGRLSRKLRRLSARGIPVIASNSDLDMVRYLYSGFVLSQSLHRVVLVPQLVARNQLVN